MRKNIVCLIVVCSMFFAGGCSSAVQKTGETSSVLSYDTKNGPKELRQSRIGDVRISGLQLRGADFEFPYNTGLNGMTRWQDYLVYGVEGGAGNDRSTVLKALSVNLKATRAGQAALQPAETVFNKGVLQPADDGRPGSFYRPVADRQGYLYFTKYHGFCSYGKDKVQRENDDYGSLQLAIDPNGTAVYGWRGKLLVRGTLDQGALKVGERYQPHGASGAFLALSDVVIGKNHQLYMSGRLSAVGETVPHKIGIYTPDLKQLALVGTDGDDDASSRGRIFPRLALTSKYIFSWKTKDMFTEPAQLCLWTLEGTYVGQASAATVLGEGWQPMEMTAWDADRLIVSAVRIQKEEENTNPENGQSYIKRTWEYGFFLVAIE